MKPLNNTSALLGTRLLQAIGIVAELMLIDARHSADSSNRYIRCTHLQQSSGIKMILKFVIAVTQPLRYVIAIAYHTLNMEIKGTAHFVY